MLTRPWPLVFLAAFQAFSPILNIFLNAHVLNVTPSYYVSSLWKYSSWFELTEFYVFPAIIGYAIFSFRLWSYPVFISLHGWLSWKNYMIFQKYPDTYSLPLFLGVTILDIALVSYFLIPAVRNAYFDPRLRWWETQTRFKVDLLGDVLNPEKKAQCHITDLSEGGVFMESDQAYELNEKVCLYFSLLDLDLTINGKIVHCRKSNGKFGYGVQFSENTRETKKDVARLSRALELVGAKPRIATPEWKVDLVNWVTSVLTTGKGLVPQPHVAGSHGLHKPKQVVNLEEYNNHKNKKSSKKAA